MSKTVTPLILGSGLSGQAIAKSLAILGTQDLGFHLAETVWLNRGVDFGALKCKYQNPVLFIANPHGLHAKAICDAEQAGFSHVVCEKPVCVNLDEVKRLQDVKIEVAVLHGYREFWGPKEIRRRIAAGELGELFSVEGKYWQSSAAERAVQGIEESKAAWKNDTSLSGKYDVLLDLGTHWVDLAAYFLDAVPYEIKVTQFYANSSERHRDSHDYIMMSFPKGVRGMVSVSKTVHGAANDLEIVVIGTKGSLSWNFMVPDQITLGRGHDRTVIARRDRTLGSGHPQFHGMGWQEGYLQVCSEVVREVGLGKRGEYPRMPQSLKLLERLLSAGSIFF